MYLEMWLWIMTGLNIIINVRGFSSGDFPQSCAELLPQHGSFSPQHIEAPFQISFKEGNDGEPFTVSLRSTDSSFFSGFMLEAQVEGDRHVGSFSQHGANPTTLLNCNGLVASAVSQGNNQPKTSFQVNWTPPPEKSLNRNIIFRATFVRTFPVFWTNVTTPPPPPSTTQPKTTPSTTQPKTTPSTTQPTTIPNTKEQPTTETTAGPTQPGTVPSSTMISTINTKTPPNVHYRKIISLQHAIRLMVAGSALLVTKMGLSDTITITNVITNSQQSRRLDRILKLSCLVVLGALEISALGLTITCDPPHATLIALVCVVIILTLLKIVIASLPLGPSHELKQICDLGAKVCSVIHEAFTIAFIYVGFLAITDKKTRGHWPLRVLIAYTAWILLSVVWIFVMPTQKHIILRRRKRVSSASAALGDGREKMRRPAGALVIQVIIFVGTIVFAAALIVGILQLPEK